MKKFATVIGSGLVAASLIFAAPAFAGGHEGGNRGPSGTGHAADGGTDSSANLKTDNFLPLGPVGANRVGTAELPIAPVGTAELPIAPVGAAG